MRAPILAMYCAQKKEKLEAYVIKASEITHAHPLAIEGAKLIALVCHAALEGWDTQAILDALPAWCVLKEYHPKLEFCIQSVKSAQELDTKALKNGLGNGISASESCVTAICFALRYRFESHGAMLRKIWKLGGDTDTIGAMAGAIWGAFNGLGKIDPQKVSSIENSEQILELAKRLYEVAYEKPEALT